MVELPANVTVRWSDGAVETVDPGAAGVTTNDPGKYHTIAAVELPNSSQRHGRYTLESRENRSSIETLPSNFAVVVVIYENNSIFSWVSSTCPGNLAFLNVTMNDYGASASFNCEGRLF